LKHSKIVTLDSSRFQSFETAQFAKDYFLANIPVKGFQYLDFVDQKKNRINIWITVAITPDQYAISLPNSPFGGFWCDKRLSSMDLEAFLSNVIEFLKAKGVRSLTINQAPKNYEPSSDFVNYLLKKSGWNLKNILSHQFFTGSKKIKKFLQIVGPKIRKRSKISGLMTKHSSISNFDFLQKIKEWNAQKGYQFLVDENYFIQQVSSFPERYFVINLEKAGQLVGVAVAVKLTSNSIYYFLSALDSSKEVKGGGDYLLFQLFLLAKEQKVEFIDLGSSDLGDRVNHSLMFFKARFSNDISNKVTWSKEF
jgi:hypothetical protein